MARFRLEKQVRRDKDTSIAGRDPHGRPAVREVFGTGPYGMVDVPSGAHKPSEAREEPLRVSG